MDCCDVLIITGHFDQSFFSPILTINRFRLEKSLAFFHKSSEKLSKQTKKTKKGDDRHHHFVKSNQIKSKDSQIKINIIIRIYCFWANFFSLYFAHFVCLPLYDCRQPKKKILWLQFWLWTGRVLKKGIFGFRSGSKLGCRFWGSGRHYQRHTNRLYFAFLQLYNYQHFDLDWQKMWFT